MDGALKNQTAVDGFVDHSGPLLDMDGLTKHFDLSNESESDEHYSHGLYDVHAAATIGCACLS